jgi:hypothetical protein
MGKIAIFGLVAALGFLLHHWLRVSYPWSVRGTVSSVASISVLVLAYSARDIDATQTISTGLTIALLATALIWGDDALSFRPERWIVLTKGVNTPGFMPFGEKPFRCPARQTQDEYSPFGVMMIAVLTGCFIEAMAGKWRLDGQHIPDANQPMGNNRDDYKGVSLLRLEPAADEFASNAAAQPEKLAVEETATNEIATNEIATNETATNETTANETTANETTANETTANETTANEITADEVDSGNPDAGKADADNTGADKDGANNNGEDANISDETQTDVDKIGDEVEMGSGEANDPGEEDLDQIIAAYQ